MTHQLARAFACALVAMTAAALSLAASAPAGAASGDLDPTFGSGGKVTADVGFAAGAVAIQGDGKTVIAGSPWGGFGVARYDRSGVLDLSFDADGKTMTDFGPGSETASALAIQPDGKIVAAGSAAPGGFCCAFALARYNRDGSLDATFGSGGKVIGALNGLTSVADLAIQPDGKIVAVGGTYSPFGSGFVVTRYNATGSLDPSFDGDGTVVTAIGSSGAANAVALDAAGRIIAAGATGGDFALARYRADGSLDQSFSGDGMLTTDFGSADSGADLAVQLDGKLVVVGGGSNRFAAARYNDDGTLDPSFDGDGRVTTTFFGENLETAAAVAIQPNGKIVSAGTVHAGFDSSFALVRYQGDGSLDLGFGTSGKLTTDFGDPADVGRLCPSGRKDCSEDHAADVALEPDGKIVVVGGAGACIPPCVSALARYQGDPVDAPPTIVIPDGIFVEATGPEGARVTYDATATDDADPAPTIVCDPASGETFALGTTTVACTAYDGAGNRATATFIVDVRDTTAPTLIVPVDLVLDAASPAGAAATYDAYATDVVDPTVAPTCEPASASTFGIGDTVVTCTATDSSANVATATFNVHVRGASEQLIALIADVAATSTKQGIVASLDAKLQAVQRALTATNAHDREGACNTVDSFIHEVEAQARGSLAAEEADLLIAKARRIQAVLACGA